VLIVVIDLTFSELRKSPLQQGNEPWIPRWFRASWRRWLSMQKVAAAHRNAVRRAAVAAKKQRLND